MKKVVIFDFDNTLVLSLPYWKEVIDHGSAKHYGVAENLDFEIKRHGLSNNDTARLFIEMHNIKNATFTDVVDYWYSYMDDKYRNEIDFVKGADWTLKYLKQKGYKLVLATATGRRLLSKAIDYFDIEKYFDLIICEEEVGKSKKEPDIYHKIFESLNVTAQDCLYFEDSVVAVTTATNIGIDCVAIISDSNEKHLDNFRNLCLATTQEYTHDLLNQVGL